MSRRSLPLLVLASLLVLSASPVHSAQVAGQEGNDTPTPRPSPEDPPAEVPEEFADAVERLRTGSIPRKGQAADRLLATEDPRVLPYLVEALEEKEEALRVRICMGILRAFPDRAADLFFSLIEDPVTARVEAALYAIASVDDPRVLPTLIGHLDAEREELRNAAARSLSNRGRAAFNAGYARALGDPRPFPATLHRIFNETRSAVIEDYIAHGPDPLRSTLLQKFADASTGPRLQTAYRAAHPDSPAAAAIETLGARLASWCPRGRLPARTTLRATMEMDNLVAGSKKQVAFAVDAVDHSALLYEPYSLLRVLPLDLPLDVLLLDPALCSPQIEASDADDGPLRIRYTLPERTLLRTGVGILNISYWQGRIAEGRSVLLELDRETGLPALERVHDEEGTVLVEIRYQDWRDAGGAAHPLSIVVRMPRAMVGAKQTSMRYEIRFRMHDEVWVLDGAEAYALEDGTEEMRAVAAVTGVSVEREPVEDPAPSPDGGVDGGLDGAVDGGGSADGDAAPGSGGGDSTGESSGQGSSAGSPRR